jgi:hypothetical protein
VLLQEALEDVDPPEKKKPEAVFRAPHKLFELLVAQCNFSDYTYKKMQPLSMFFKHVPGGTPAPVPPTLVLEAGGTRFHWLYQGALDESGDRVLKVRTYEDGSALKDDMQSVLRRMIRGADDFVDEDVPTAVVKIQKEGTQSNELRVLHTAAALQAELQMLCCSEASNQTITVQKYVKPKSQQPWIVRAVYQDQKPGYAWVITGHDGHFIREYTQKNCSIVKSTTANTWPRPRAMLERMVHSIEEVQQLNFTEMAADFLQDSNGSWWLLQVKSFKLNPKVSAFMKLKRETGAPHGAAQGSFGGSEFASKEKIGKNGTFKCSGEFCSALTTAASRLLAKHTSSVPRLLPHKVLLLDRFHAQNAPTSDEDEVHESAAVRETRFLQSLSRLERNKLYNQVTVCEECYAMYTQRKHIYDSMVQSDAAADAAEKGRVKEERAVKHQRNKEARGKQQELEKERRMQHPKDRGRARRGSRHKSSQEPVPPAPIDGSTDAGESSAELRVTDGGAERVEGGDHRERHGQKEVQIVIDRDTKGITKNLEQAMDKSKSLIKHAEKMSPSPKKVPSPKLTKSKHGKTARVKDPSLVSFVERMAGGGMRSETELAKAVQDAQRSGYDKADDRVDDAAELQHTMRDLEEQLRDAVDAEDFELAAELDAKRLAIREQTKQLAHTAQQLTAAADASSSEKHQPVTLRCGWGCGARFVAKELTKHEEEDCELREVLCPLGCGKDLVAKQLKQHQKVKCPKRKVRCPAGCGLSITADQQPIHVSTQCPQRPVVCSRACGMSVTFERSGQHEAAECPHRLVCCEKGCGRQLLAKNIGAHTVGCSGSLPMVSIAGLVCSNIFGDESYKETIIERATNGLENGERVLLSAELRENNRSVDDCQLLLRTLYMDLRDSCQDLGFIPEVMLEGGGPRGGGVAMLELHPQTRFISEKPA